MADSQSFGYFWRARDWSRTEGTRSTSRRSSSKGWKTTPVMGSPSPAPAVAMVGQFLELFRGKRRREAEGEEAAVEMREVGGERNWDAFRIMVDSRERERRELWTEEWRGRLFNFLKGLVLHIGPPRMSSYNSNKIEN